MNKDSNECVFVTEKSKIFPSTRFLMAGLLCFCFIALSAGTSNISQSMVCMVYKPSESLDPLNITSCNHNDDEITSVPCYHSKKFAWTSMQQGFVYAGQNFGSLLMVVCGWQADRLNGKWTITASLVLLIASSAFVPLAAPVSVWLVFFLRVLTGVSDSFLFPAASSMITRWFPPKERPFALGFVTGGRQIGTLVILPVAGVLCEKNGHGMFDGWPAIFYVSAITAAAVLIIWVMFSADKPSKHLCIPLSEEMYISRKIEEENVGKRTKRGNPPWGKLARCRSLYVAVAALVCHEFPLVIMLQFLPKFFSDVLGLSSAMNGLFSALPMAVLFLSKTLSSSLASIITSKFMGKTASCKMFNFIASLGLGVCIGITPLFGNVGHPAYAITLLCLANAFAGLHTPGVQTALVQIAPAYTGVVTGITFTVAACFSIINKLLTSQILTTGSKREWTIVFEISAVVALLPVVFFTLWGSAERESWASNRSSKPKEADQKSDDSQASNDSAVQTFAKYSLYLTHDLTHSA
ncbi:unnamed protein product [Caenorhabditis auriculariae]|uniref:Major facilitator superfamily (MFS) profile domain-containing protein n=1 Tax=Caenorhabditis auriculariae TaxID=2777116 RepID=A0A8S1H0B1_9PELO|nr:unnamed protein product [Caenorhabditis auriculariae]